MASSGSGDELRVGVAARPLAALLGSLRELLAELDPGQLPARDAAEVVTVCDHISRVADAGKALAAGQVAESSLWSRGGHRSAAHWMAKVCGVSVGEAVRMLELAESVAEAPATKDALVAGTLSGRQASEVARAEKADSVAGRALAGSASGRSLNDVQGDARRIVAAASTETPGEKAQRHRRNRRVWHGVDADGMGIGGWRLPMPQYLRFVSGLEAEQQAVFTEKRAAGEREPVEAYAADAFCRLLDRALTPTRPAAGESGDGDAGEDWSFAKVIVKVDLAALDRGRVEAGEICEVAGQGPIPVSDVWRMIDGDAFIAAVSTKGTEISKVVHLGRRPTALQRTALEAIGDGTCQIDGCRSRARLEIDHVSEWAATHRTELGELAQACGHHHDLKTHHGYTFGPLMPDGRRQLIPPPGVEPSRDGEPPGAGRADGPPAAHGLLGRPDVTADGTGPTDGTGPPRLTLHDGDRPPTPRRTAEAEQRGLFDTG